MKKEILFCCISIFCLSGLSAFAATEDEPIDIERIVVTADRTQENVREASKSTTVIGPEAIAASNAQTIPDLLRTEADIDIRDYTGTGKTVNVDMGGFGETGPSNMLVLIDGRRVNAIDITNTDWSQISLSQIERIEIVRGASSVLYGDNASGGVVNIITKKGKGKPSVKIQTEGGSYQTASTKVEASGSDEKSSFRASGEYFNTDGYRQNSQLFRKDFGLQLGHTFDPLLDTNFTFGYHKDRYGLPGALKANELSALGRRATTNPNDTAETQDYFGNYEITNDFKNYGKLSTNFSARVKEAEGTYVSRSWKNANRIVTLGLTPKYTLESSLFNLSQKTILGIDLYHHDDHILDGALAGPNDTINIDKTSSGFYGQDEIHLNDHLILKGGLRHEMARYLFNQVAQVQLKEKSDLSSTVYNIGLVAPYSTESNLFFDYSTSFRYPLVDEFFSSNTYGFGGLNASLQPQTSQNIEVGVRHFFTKDNNLNLMFFNQLIKNEIFLDQELFSNTNYPHTTHRGVELESNVRVTRHLKLFANYTFTQAEFGEGKFQGKKIPGVPEHKYSAGVSVTPNDHLKINLIANYVGKMYFISDANNAFHLLKDWTTIDLNVNYSWANFEIFLGLNNIFNTYYSEYGVLSSGFPPPRVNAYYPSPGRNVLAGCRYKF